MKCDVWIFSVDSFYTVAKDQWNGFKLQLIGERKHHQKHWKWIICLENGSALDQIRNCNQNNSISTNHFRWFCQRALLRASSISAKRCQLFTVTFIILYAKITAYKSFVWYNFRMICRCTFKGFGCFSSHTHFHTYKNSHANHMMRFNDTLENWKIKWKKEKQNTWYFSMWIQIEL